MSEHLNWTVCLDRYEQQFLTSEKLFTDETKQKDVAALKDFQAFLNTLHHIENPAEIKGYHLRAYLRDISSLDKDEKQNKLNVLRSFFKFIADEQLIEFNYASELPEFRSRDEILWGGRNEKKVLSSKLPEKTLEEFLSEYARFKPSDIRNYLASKVVGQDTAITYLSVLLSMHLNWFKSANKLHRAPNAILIGPTGVGKTHTIRTAAEFLKIPFVTVDSTALVEAGIVGIQIEDILEELVLEANRILNNAKVERSPNDDIDLARRGIIFFDEFDKVNTHRENKTQMDGKNLAIQRRMLKATDGAILKLGVIHRDGADDRSIDTTGILILTGGAFVGIDDNKIRTMRPKELQRELARSNPNSIVSADVVNFGFLEELVARLPLIIEYKPLTESDLFSLLDIAELSPMQVWIEYFKGLGKELIITEQAKAIAAKRALILKMGARGLQQVIFPSLSKIAYDIGTSPEATFILDVHHLNEAPTP